MRKANLTEWRLELLSVGHIVQDEDQSAAQGDAERRFNRYIQLIDELDGSAGPEAARALVQSIQVPNDYGAYERTLNALLFLFPPPQSAAAIVSELPRLIESLPDWAGNLLSSVARAGATSGTLVPALNVVLAATVTSDREKIMSFIRQEELCGWLEDRRGVFSGVGL